MAVTLSFVVAFKDPDGSIACDLICAKSLYVFSVQATVCKWKYKVPPPKVHRLVDTQLAQQAISGNLQLPPKPGAML